LREAGGWALGGLRQRVMRCEADRGAGGVGTWKVCRRDANLAAPARRAWRERHGPSPARQRPRQPSERVCRKRARPHLEPQRVTQRLEGVLAGRVSPKQGEGQAPGLRRRRAGRRAGGGAVSTAARRRCV
jgi:hypothetical protein